MDDTASKTIVHEVVTIARHMHLVECFVVWVALVFLARIRPSPQDRWWRHATSVSFGICSGAFNFLSVSFLTEGYPRPSSLYSIFYTLVTIYPVTPFLLLVAGVDICFSKDSKSRKGASLLILAIQLAQFFYLTWIWQFSS